MGATAVQRSRADVRNSVVGLDRRSRVVWWTVIAACAVTLLLLASLWGLAMWRSLEQHEQAVAQDARNLVAAVSESIEAQVASVDAALISSVAHLEEDLERGHVDRPRAAQHLLALTRARPEIEGLRVVDADGLGVLGPGLAGPDPVSFRDRAWFIRQRDDAHAGLLMSEPLTAKLNRSHILSFSRRLNHADGRFAGAVTAAIPIQVFVDQLKRIDTGPGGMIALRDMSKHLIARLPDAATGSPAQTGNSQVSPEMLAALAQGARHGQFFTDKLDGQARLITFQRLSRAPLLLIIGVAQSHYLAPWRRDLAISAGVGAVVAFSYLMVAVVVLRQFRANLVSEGRIRLLAEVFKKSGDPIMVVDRMGAVVEANDAFARTTGLPSIEIIGRNPVELLSDQTTPRSRDQLVEALESSASWQGEVVGRRRDGGAFPAFVSVTAVEDANRQISHHVVSLIDLSEVKREEERMVHLARHDALTGLPNRSTLHERLSQALLLAQRDESALAVMFIDIDRFKHINDTLGHEVGDKLLVEVARRLRNACRQSDIVARLGGDEFVLGACGLGAQADEFARLLAVKINRLLSEPYAVANIDLHTTSSIGISLFPGDGSHVEALLRCADLAMYRAKNQGRSQIALFTQEMDAAASDRFRLDVELTHAMERGEFSVQYQLQQRMSDGRFVAAEALLRWQHPVLGSIAPVRFIPVAEDSGQITSIGLWVLRRALADVARWRRQEAADFKVAVNISAVQLISDGLVDTVQAELAMAGLDGSCLELEVTETAAMRDPERTVAQLVALRKLGISIAIDDFGTGTSSLAYLKQFPLSCLKLDRSFVQDIDTDPGDQTICQATVVLAHALSLSVVAEGVETVGQLERLRELQCDVVQGYLVGLPVEAAAVTRALRGNRQANPT